MKSVECQHLRFIDKTMIDSARFEVRSQIRRQKLQYIHHLSSNCYVRHHVLDFPVVVDDRRSELELDHVNVNDDDDVNSDDSGIVITDRDSKYMELVRQTVDNHFEISLGLLDEFEGGGYYYCYSIQFNSIYISNYMIHNCYYLTKNQI